MLYGYTTFILEDPHYYNLTKEQAGAALGYSGFVAEAIVIVSDLFMGIIVDTYGRKIPIVAGLLASALAMAAIPMFTNANTGYLTMRIILSVGTNIGFQLPLIPDYVVKESQGLATSYSELAKLVGGIVSGAGLLQLNKVVHR